MRVNTRLTNKSIELWTKINPSGPFGGIFCFLTYNWQAIFIFHVHRLLPCRASSNCDGEFKLYRAREAVCMYNWDYMNKRKEKYMNTIYPSPTFILFHWRRIYITSFEALFSANCPVLRMLGCFLLPPRRSRFFARIARWKLLSLRKTKETKHHKASLTTNLTANLTLTIVHKKRKRIN